MCRPGPGNEASAMPEISDECRRKFEQWWSSQLTSSNRAHFTMQYPSQYSQSLQTPKPLERTLPDPSHPAMQSVHSQFPTQKTRMRTSFDPELELPKLQRWFADNQHPSRQQIQQYVKELNSLESRRGRKPLDVNNVVYWFKNARAAQKRAEVRNVTPGLQCPLPMNGYNDHSPNGNAGLLMSDCYLNSDHALKSNFVSAYRRGYPTRMSDEMSNATSDMEDDEIPDESRPQSPTGPLSLITTKRESIDGSPHRRTPPSTPNDDRVC